MSKEYLQGQFRRYFPDAKAIDVNFLEDQEKTVVDVTIVSAEGPTMFTFVCEAGSDDDWFRFEEIEDSYIVISIPFEPEPVERLISCAIVRNGTLQVGFKSHSELRASLGDVDPYAQKLRPADIEGFFTSKDRFVTREQAKIVGEAAGQCRPMVRELLSSDITWD